MTKIFNKLILIALMSISFMSADAQRPKGHRWYKGTDTPTKEWLRSQYDGSDTWSPSWNISREEAVKMQLFNLEQSFKMAGSQKKVEPGHLYWMIENSQIETVPPGTVFTNTLVRNDGVAVSFVDTVAKDGEKFFVAKVNNRKIAWAKAACLQSTVLVSSEPKSSEPEEVYEPVSTIVAQTPDVKVYGGDVTVGAPNVYVIDSTGDTYITNNYIQQDQYQPLQQQPYFGAQMNTGLYAQASIGWGMQQPFCNPWGNSMYYGPRGGGGYVCGNGGSNNQPINVYVDVYNNNVNTNTNTNTNTITFEQDPHIYHPPTGGPVDPTGGDPVDGGGVDDGPIDPESRYSTANVGYNPTRNQRSVRQPQSSQTTAVRTSSRNTEASAPVRNLRSESSKSSGVSRGVTRNNTQPAPATVRSAPARQQQNSEAKPRMFASRAANERGGNTSAQSRSGNSQPRYNQQQGGGRQNYQPSQSNRSSSVAPRQNYQAQPQMRMSQARPAGGGSNGGSPQNGRNFQPQGGGFARR